MIRVTFIDFLLDFLKKKRKKKQKKKEKKNFLDLKEDEDLNLKD
jgi:hypothetical protein